MSGTTRTARRRPAPGSWRSGSTAELLPRKVGVRVPLRPYPWDRPVVQRENTRPITARRGFASRPRHAQVG